MQILDKFDFYIYYFNINIKKNKKLKTKKNNFKLQKKYSELQLEQEINYKFLNILFIDNDLKTFYNYLHVNNLFFVSKTNNFNKIIKKI